jgi:hypothetical protein
VATIEKKCGKLLEAEIKIGIVRSNQPNYEGSFLKKRIFDLEPLLGALKTK